MIIEKIVLGPVQTNTYLMIDEVTHKTVVIDPSAHVERILSKVKQNNLEVVSILITHGHFDHIGAVSELKEETGAEVAIHEAGERYLTDASYHLGDDFGMSISSDLKADRYLKADEEIKIEGTDIVFKVIHVPGHTLDGVAYYCEKHGLAFVGDILFRANVGRTDLPGGDSQMLLTNIKRKLFKLPDDTVIYSGHGEPTTIGYEKRYNPHF